MELIAAEGDWAGTQAYPRYLQAVHEEYARGTPICEALVSPRNVSLIAIQSGVFHSASAAY